jgi:hypothetical protein
MGARDRCGEVFVDKAGGGELVGGRSGGEGAAGAGEGWVRSGSER